jgi:iron complex outermembrane receptor protein
MTITKNEDHKVTHTHEHPIFKKTRLGLLIALATGCISTTVSAQQSDVVSSAPAKQDNIEVINVSGIRGSLMRGLAQKQQATGIVDAISAEELGKFPDINLSESLQRIPGITLNRDDGGRGQAVNLRGLSPGFTRVEINGMTAPSNGSVGGGRGFDFGLLPSELFTNAAVFKTGRARDSEGGLAGLIQLTTPQPFENEGLKVVASVQGDYSANASDLGSRSTLLISNNIDDKFGISAGVVYTSQQYQSSQVGGLNTRPLASILTSDAAALATPEQLAAQVTNIEHYIHDFEDRDTLSANMAIQWQLSDDIEVSINGLYSDLNADRFFTRADAPSEGNVTGFSNLVVENGLVTSASLSGVQQRLGVNDASSEEDLMQITAKVKWQANEDWLVTPFVGFSKRDVQRVGNLLSYRRADLSTGDFVNGDVSYVYRGDFVDWTTTGTDFSSRPEEFLLNVFLLRPSTDEDKDLTTKLDFARTFVDGALSLVNFGVRYSDREISRTGADTRVVAQSGFDRRLLPSLADAGVVLDNFQVDGAPSSVPSNILGVNTALAVSLFAPNGLDGAAITGASIAPRPLVTAQRSFDVQEKTFNAYAEATFDMDEVVFNTGLRYLRTEQISGGFAIVNGVASPISFDNSYKAFLPSISARYEIQDDVMIRAAYSRTLTRPSLGNLAPTEIVNGVDEGGGTGTQGNPNLLPFTADNIDLGVDWYFEDGGYVAVSLYYKDIDDIIDTESFTEDRTFPRQRDDVLVTAPIVFSRPSNGVTATIEGLELSGQLPFSLFSDGMLENAGMFANYTYANSAADFSTEGDARSSGLPGLSENSFNIAAYYDDGTFETRLAYAWRSDYLEAFSGAFGVPRFEESRGQVDFSASYEIIENLVLQFQALNLTDSQRVQTTTAAFRAPNNVRQLDRRYLFGARYSF